jgi:hypothetical protein
LILAITFAACSAAAATSSGKLGQRLVEAGAAGQRLH